MNIATSLCALAILGLILAVKYIIKLETEIRFRIRYINELELELIKEGKLIRELSARIVRARKRCHKK